MADFEKAFKKVLELEGGYVDCEGDYGGETKYGISKRWYPELDIKSLTIEDAKRIYKRDYWDKLSLDYVEDQEVAEELLDIAINMGWMRAARFLQEALNLLVNDNYLKVDGLIGPLTLQAVNRYKLTKALLKTLNGLQFMHYYQRIKEDETQRKFFRGWLRRIEV